MMAGDGIRTQAGAAPVRVAGGQRYRLYYMSFRYANVDAAQHRFRPNRPAPWLANVFEL